MTLLEQFPQSNAAAENSDARSGLLNEYCSMSYADQVTPQHNPSNKQTADSIINLFGDLQITPGDNHSPSPSPSSPETSLASILNQLPRPAGNPPEVSAPSGEHRSLQQLGEAAALNALRNVAEDGPKVFTVEVPVIDYNKAEVTPDTIKQAKEKFEKEMKKDAPPKGTEEMVKTIADGILSGDPAVIQKLLKDVKTPEDLEKLQKAAEYVGQKLGIYAAAGKTFDGKPYLQMRAYFQHQSLAGAWENDVHMSIYPDEVSTSMKSTLPVAGEDRPRLKKVDPKFLTSYLQKGLVNKDK